MTGGEVEDVKGNRKGKWMNLWVMGMGSRNEGRRIDRSKGTLEREVGEVKDNKGKKIRGMRVKGIGDSIENKGRASEESDEKWWNSKLEK